jgi:fatty acid desaturase
MQLWPISKYVRELKPLLPREAFEPARSRLLWLPVHAAAIIAIIYAVATGLVPWPLLPVASIALGISFAGTTFVGHETAHGGTIRGRRWKHAITYVAFLPFNLSPTLWKVWHNREHHAHTNNARNDPDQYPLLPAYQRSRVVRVVTDRFALGARRWTGVLSLLFGFTGQSTKILVDAHRRGWMSKRQHRIAIAETLSGVALWATVAWLVGPLAFLFVFVLPLVVANWIVMAFILTNHGLSPLTGDVNDPLVNSLSVTVPRLYDFVTLGFGYHTEHHLFPAMSTRHAPKVRALLLEKYPGRYQSMPLGQALLSLHRTARVYRDHVTLTDPRTGAVWSTLLPREPA